MFVHCNALQRANVRDSFLQAERIRTGEQAVQTVLHTGKQLNRTEAVNGTLDRVAALIKTRCLQVMTAKHERCSRQTHCEAVQETHCEPGCLLPPSQAVRTSSFPLLGIWLPSLALSTLWVGAPAISLHAPCPHLSVTAAPLLRTGITHHIFGVSSSASEDQRARG